ncbi:MAG: histidine kinase dimerization/phospho-acceptor domain-containing protein, partial [bacterium]
GAPATAADDNYSSGERETVAGTATLLMLLSRLNRLLESHPPGVRNAAETQAELTAATAAITTAMEAMANRTSDKLARLAALAATLRGGGPTSAPAKRQRAAHHNLFAILAEIIQELLQPLCVIRCAVEMLQGARLGEMPAEQTDLLRLVADSNNRLQHLVEKLHVICGNPASRTPNPQILDYIYDRTGGETATKTLVDGHQG